MPKGMYPRNQEYRQIMSRAKMGMKMPPFTDEHRKNMSEARRGMKFTDEHRRNLSIAHAGIKLPPFTAEHRRKLSEAQTGKTGELSPSWQGGKSFEPYCELFNDEKKEEIRNRDNRVCRLCNKSELLNGRRLDVHHINADKMQGCNGKKWYLAALCRSCNSKKDTTEKEFLIVSNAIL